MSARPRYGVRKIEDVDGGCIAWLYPGGADLDDVLAQIARYQADEDQVEWWATTMHRTLGPEPRRPEGPYSDHQAEWDEHFTHRPPVVSTLDEEHPTALSIVDGEPDVGYYRRMPWCHCGDGHAWHFEPADGPARGVSLAVVVSSW